jgi:trypsin
MSGESRIPDRTFLTAKDSEVFTSLWISDGVPPDAVNADDMHHHRRHLSTTNLTDTPTRNNNTTAQNDNTMIVPEARIVGGESVNDGVYPFFIQGYGCGASLIAPDMALTAAHCNQPGVFDSDVIVGSNLPGALSASAEQRWVSKSIPHEWYSYYSEEYDFMLLKLDQALDTNKYPPVLINDQASIPAVGDPLTVIGLGYTRENGSPSDQLRQVTINAQDPSSCSNVYSYGFDGDLMVCAGEWNGGKDACQGDSGGPLLTANGVQVGIVSWGNGCARPFNYGVYSRVSSVMEWIHRVVCEESNAKPDYCKVQNAVEPSTEAPVTTTTSSSSGGPTPPSSFSTGDILLDIKVTHDKYPLDTAWAVIDDITGAIVASQQAGDFTTPYGTNEATVSVSPGTYTFRMMDSYGDGACCQYGDGKIVITANGEEVLSAVARFRSNAYASFLVPDAEESRNAPTTSATASEHFQIQIQYDNYPDDISITIQEVDTGTTVFVAPINNKLPAGAYITGILKALRPGVKYELTIQDFYGDGMCCEYGKGYVTITMIDASGNLIDTVLHVDGSFGAGTTQEFTTPSSP